MPPWHESAGEVPAREREHHGLRETRGSIAAKEPHDACHRAEWHDCAKAARDADDPAFLDVRRRLESAPLHRELLALLLELALDARAPREQRLPGRRT